MNQADFAFLYTGSIKTDPIRARDILAFPYYRSLHSRVSAKGRILSRIRRILFDQSPPLCWHPAVDEAKHMPITPEIKASRPANQTPQTRVAKVRHTPFPQIQTIGNIIRQ